MIPPESVPTTATTQQGPCQPTLQILLLSGRLRGCNHAVRRGAGDDPPNRRKGQIIERFEPHTRLSHVELLTRFRELLFEKLALFWVDIRAHQIDGVIVLLCCQRGITERLAVV